jgi:hypothetical protein
LAVYDLALSVDKSETSVALDSHAFIEDIGPFLSFNWAFNFRAFSIDELVAWMTGKSDALSVFELEINLAANSCAFTIRSFDEASVTLLLASFAVFIDLLHDVAWWTGTVGTFLSIPLETFPFWASWLTFITYNMVVRFAFDLDALVFLHLLTSSALKLEALAVDERESFLARSDDADTIFHLFIWFTGLLVAGVSNSDFSWATLDDLADTVDVLLSSWAGDVETDGNDGGWVADYGVDTFILNSSGSAWAADFNRGLLSVDALVASDSMLFWAFGNTFLVVKSEPSLWAGKLAFWCRHISSLLWSKLDFPSDRLELHFTS